MTLHEVRHKVPSKFHVVVNHESCIKCKRCVINCSFGAMSFNGDRIVPDDSKCVSCQRCAVMCPQGAISIQPGTISFAPHGTYSDRTRRIIMEQASTGGVLLSSTGSDIPYRNIFDDILLDAAQVTNPSIDPLREPIETAVYFGSRRDRVEIEEDGDTIKMKEMPSVMKLRTPIVVGHMSLGAISYNAYHAILMGSKRFGVMVGSGEGGLHKDFYKYADIINTEIASGRFGIDMPYLKNSAAIEIKIGQGAKPGHGGHLPGEKVSALVSKTRMIPKGSDALSPYPHHDTYSIEDLHQLISALKEASEYKKPVGVKIAAVHNVAAIASGIVRAGADFVTIDGMTGGTGAAPRIIRDHAGMPLPLAIAAVDRRLREENIRHKTTLVAGGSIRYSADFVKALALGADIVMISTPLLISLGCRMCQQCHRGICPWGITTQRPDLVQRLNVNVAAQRVYNLFNAWNEELAEILGALGIDAVEGLIGNRDRLRYIGPNPKIAEILGVKHSGQAWEE